MPSDLPQSKPRNPSPGIRKRFAKFPERCVIRNSYATPTPVTDGERVYAVFHDGTVVAVDFSGKTLWRNSEVQFFSLHGLGPSPLLVNGQLVMPFDGSSQESERVGWKILWENAVVLSLDATSGAVKWKGLRGLSRVGRVTPILVGEESQIVTAGEIVSKFRSADW